MKQHANEEVSRGACMRVIVIRVSQRSEKTMTQCQTKLRF